MFLKILTNGRWIARRLTPVLLGAFIAQLAAGAIRQHPENITTTVPNHAARRFGTEIYISESARGIRLVRMNSADSAACEVE
jgi:hypothetical protein